MNKLRALCKSRISCTALLLSALLAVAPGGLFAHETDCFDLFAKLDEKIGRPVDTPAYADLTSHRASVTELGQEAGEHGGKRIRLKKTGAQWGSIFTTNNFDRQGDPRWFISLLGEKQAEFFGFKMMGTEEMLIPDYEEFTGALKKVNEALIAKGKQPASITFYKTPDNHNVKVGSYVESFIKDHGIPIAPSGNHMIHDISYHTGAIFMPDHLLKEGAARTKYHRDFSEFLKRKYADDPAKKEAAIFYSYLFKFLDTAYIDTATARIGPTVAGFSNKMALIGKEAVTHEMKNMVKHSVISIARDLAEGTTARTAFEKHIGLMIGASKINPGGIINEAKRRAAIQAFPMEEVYKDLEKFSRGYVPEGFPDFSPENIRLSTVEERDAYLDRLCRELTAARDKFLSVTAGLVEPQPK